jgi:hypothetical protein
MSYIVQGYLDGVSYAVVVDPTQKDPDRGIVKQGPDSVLAAIAAQAGEMVHITIPGEAVEVSLNTPIGVLAGLSQVTEITRVEGDLPSGWPGVDVDEDTPADAVH